MAVSRAPLPHGDSRHGGVREPPQEWVAGDRRVTAVVALAQGMSFPCDRNFEKQQMVEVIQFRVVFSKIIRYKACRILEAERSKRVE